MLKKRDLFPIFKKVTLRHRNLISGITSALQPYCDFNFANIYNWSHPARPTFFSTLNGNLIIKMRDFTTDREVVSVCGVNALYSTVKMLLSTFDELSMVPEEVITSDLLNDPEVIVEEDRGNFDYLLSLEELATLEGNKYKSKRKFVRKFKKLYKDHSVEILDPSDARIRRKILGLIRRWGRLKNLTKKNIEFELHAVKRSLSLAPYLNMLIMGIYHEGNRLISFNINEFQASDMIMGSFGKTDLTFKGLASYSEHVTAKELLKRGYKFLNFEQDLDLNGLRKAKLSWRHIKFLKKYKIRRVDTSTVAQ